jgi:hypothetical protein
LLPLNVLQWTPIRRWAVLLLWAVLLTACAPWQPAPQRLSISRWSVEVPDGWMRLRTPDYEMLSKDGPYLQFILIQARPMNYQFRFTRQRMTPDLLPHEAARVIIGNLRSDPQIKDFKLISNTPAAMAGEMGFRLEYTYVDPQGVDTQGIYCGMLLPDLFIDLQYTAAKRYYFAKDAASFEQVFRSFRLASDHPPG